MPTVHARALLRAVEILGGIDELARQVDVPAYDLAVWMKGEVMPPLAVFLKAVDIISEHETGRLHRLGTRPTGAPGQRALRMLVIDDRAEVRYLAGKRLRKLGHEVYEAADGATGLELARQHRPDVILVDIVLPDMPGYEVGRLLRAEFGRTALIAAVTGFAELDASKSFEAGFDRHFRSPIEPAELERWLNSAPSEA